MTSVIPEIFHECDGALLVGKPAGPTSFGVIEAIQRALVARTGLKRRDLPKLGHGGTLDPFATGLLVVGVGRGVLLTRYFLSSEKTYTGVIRFGETTPSGDPTLPASETSEQRPSSIDEIQAIADNFTKQIYSQVPPMFSAKKKDGKPLYELARAGVEIEREPRDCIIHEFQILSHENDRARFRVRCSAGTYIRVLAQDLGRMLGTVALLESLERTGCGGFSLDRALGLKALLEKLESGTRLPELPSWIPFDQMLQEHPRAEISDTEARDLSQGRQYALPAITARATEAQSAKVAGLYSGAKLVGVASLGRNGWALDRIFVRG